MKECPFNKTVMYGNKNKSLPVTRTCSERDNDPYMELFWDKPDGVSGNSYNQSGIVILKEAVNFSMKGNKSSHIFEPF